MSERFQTRRGRRDRRRFAYLSVGDGRVSVVSGRADAIAWARQVTADPRTVYLDTETTGLGPDAEVVDIAVVGAAGEVLLQTLVRPSRAIPADASRIHQIYDHHVVDAPAWGEVSPTLCAVLDGRTVVVYNAAFDRKMVTQCCARLRASVPGGDWHCAMLRYAAFRGDSNAARSGYRWHSLDSAVAAFGVPAGGHRAFGDAMACRAVVIGMASAGADAVG